MNQTIKFRAYIKSLKWSLPVERICFDCKTVEIDLTDGNGDTSEYEFDEVELIQFTGRKDKNRVDIFDGDAVDGSYINPMTGETIKRIYSVVFENGCYIARLIGKSPYGDTQLYFVNEKCEVIGNIYDNPEFLEVER